MYIGHFIEDGVGMYIGHFIGDMVQVCMYNL